MYDTEHIITAIETFMRNRRGPPDIVQRVRAALDRYPMPRVIEVAQHMLTDPDPDRRYDGGVMLLYLDPENYTSLVARLLSDPDEHVRASTAMVLGSCGWQARAAVPKLIKVLQSDPYTNARVKAAEALGLIGDPQAIPALQVAAEHDRGIGWENHEVGATAQRAIEDILRQTS